MNGFEGSWSVKRSNLYMCIVQDLSTKYQNLLELKCIVFFKKKTLTQIKNLFFFFSINHAVSQTLTQINSHLHRVIKNLLKREILIEGEIWV